MERSLSIVRQEVGRREKLEIRNSEQAGNPKFEEIRRSCRETAAGLVGGGDDEDLFERGNTLADAVQRDHSERAHALADGNLSEFATVRAGDDQLAELIADGHGFDDG